MARYRKSSFVRDNLPYFLTGLFVGLLSVILIGTYPRYSPVIRQLLPGEGEAPPVESTAPPAESTAPPEEITTPPAESTAPPAESTAPAENTAPPAEDTEDAGLGKQLWRKVVKFWPGVLALIAVMEGAEYIGKFFGLIRKFFHFLGERF